MSSENRLKRLRDLLDQLERLPPTPERERMLRDVRSRLVDVDTGVAPSPLAPVHREESKPAADPRSPIRRAPRVVATTLADEGRRPRATRLRPPAKPVEESPGTAAPVVGAEVAAGGFPAGPGGGLTVAADELLCLDDSASFSPSEGGTEPSQAWTRGLRG